MTLPHHHPSIHIDAEILLISVWWWMGSVQSHFHKKKQSLVMLGDSNWESYKIDTFYKSLHILLNGDIYNQYICCIDKCWNDRCHLFLICKLIPCTFPSGRSSWGLLFFLLPHSATRPNLDVSLMYCKSSLAGWAIKLHYCSGGKTQPPCVRLEIYVLCNLGSWYLVYLLWTGPVRTGQVRDSQVNTGQLRTGQVRIGQVRIGHARTGSIRKVK